MHSSKHSERTAQPNALAENRSLITQASERVSAGAGLASFARESTPARRGWSRWVLIGCVIGLSALFAWANWAALVDLVETWNREPDYSHGYLVGPIAILILWFRRDRIPRVGSVPGWGGFALVGLSVLLGMAGRQYFLNPLACWAMIAWIGGVVWVLAGRHVFWWALPGIAFLFFMAPLPYRMEGMLSGPLQRMATLFSCWTLQVLGQPAFAEGNTIFLGMTQLEVEHACSGLRMLVMISALATACAVLICRNGLERLFVAICIVPVAMFANCVRIVATGLAYQYLSDDASKAILHDVAGWAVVPVAAASMGLALFYWRRLIVESTPSRMALSQYTERTRNKAVASFDAP